MNGPGAPRRALLRGAALGALVCAVPLLAGCAADEPNEVTSVQGLTFPPNFAWGVATSAYQIEGAAAEDGRKPSIWDTFSHIQGKTANGATGDVAVDHYHRWQADLDLMRDLGIRSYRFSIAWPRVLPEGTGTPNQAALDFYRRLVDGLHRRGITPVVTLFHWDLPQALQYRGGWYNRDCAHWFANYANVAFRALGDGVKTWLTINEPKTVVKVGYQSGRHAPGQKNVPRSYVVLHHLLLGHGLAVQALRAVDHFSHIGPVLNLNPIYPTTDTASGRAQVALADTKENRVYLDPILQGTYPPSWLAKFAAESPLRKAIQDGDLAIISSGVDLLGVNYYSPVFVSEQGKYVTVKPTTLARWEQVYPQGLYDLLIGLKARYPRLPPISITENGLPTPDTLAGHDVVADPARIAYLRDHLAAAHRAIAAGVRVDGYYVWSLLDNFEWAEGYSQRWGLVYVDWPSQRRIVKLSGQWYRDVIRRNGI